MIRPKKDGAARVREDTFLGDLVPQVTDQLARRRSGDFDAAAGQARFEAWLAAHSKEPAVPAPRVRVPPARRPAGTPGWVKLGTGLAAIGAELTESILHPAAAEALGIADAAIPLIVGVVLYTTIVRGSPETVERVFRLLRWISNRPDPPAPGSSSSQSSAAAEHPSAQKTADTGPAPSATPGLSAGNDPIAQQPRRAP